MRRGGIRDPRRECLKGAGWECQGGVTLLYAMPRLLLQGPVPRAGRRRGAAAKHGDAPQSHPGGPSKPRNLLLDCSARALHALGDTPHPMKLTASIVDWGPRSSVCTRKGLGLHAQLNSETNDGDSLRCLSHFC